jgi:hypothetical protein
MDNMDIKIPSGPSQSQPLDAVNDSAQPIEGTRGTEQTAETTSVSTDPIAQIAEQVAAGAMERDQAIEAILNQVMDSKMVESAPKGAREELEEVLRALLDTDPHLQSLSAVLGPKIASNAL